MWSWMADRMMDDPDTMSASSSMDQLSMYGARGMFIESTDATWLYTFDDDEQNVLRSDRRTSLW
ncbi:hypothetical protein HMPREF1624_05106 [Sporothrix schenckii ATCC 58251]|uniref:Uncharacterized protein n=2 Tax=Sporothrix schenckii TaxID=29908 RepID=U7PRU7_SPOS1|nr:hypothetical protein HMPREF1624_05106 [Sporothrix schenckii ATCC 58251]